MSRYQSYQQPGEGGKNLHSMLITETYWATSIASSTLYSALIGVDALTYKKIRRFIQGFNVFFNNTYIEISRDNEDLIKEIDDVFQDINLFKNEKYRGEQRPDTRQLFRLLSLWKQYNLQVQQNPLMELIKHTTVMEDTDGL